MEFVSEHIKPLHLYRDEHSADPNVRHKKTNSKPKNKLAGYKIPLDEIKKFPFFELTSKEDRCIKNLTIKIDRNRWEDLINKNHLAKGVGYLDISKFEHIDYKEIKKKIKNKRNGFGKIAKLPFEDFEQIKVLSKNLFKCKKAINNKEDIIKALGLDVEEENQSKLKELNLLD